MNRFVTVATFQYPHQAHVIKSKLESQGIAVFLKDELTVQAYNFLSNAVGGIKLQISESDYEKAYPLLKEAGLLDIEDEKPSWIFKWIDNRTNKIPVVKKWPVEIRGLILAGIIMILISAIVFIINLPSKEERLSEIRQKKEKELTDKLENFHLPIIDSLIYPNPQLAVNYSKELLSTSYPNNENLYLMLAYGYVQLDSFSLASENFSNSMIYGFKNPNGFAGMAYCQVQLGNYEEAIDYLKSAVEINEDYKSQLASVYELNEDWSSAEKYYSEYIEEREKWDRNNDINADFQKVKLKRDSIRGLID
ncbi:tetratricopeptide (TPR) repeat protein [Algoriphagus iocasae]|jgi:tetratricopeptide (TPR) repeat protein|uniref:Tetratricopeptide (TPR) repeat protein n=1 Tax=Algoriphagus iocasae TaxID=1836499 RepID=A0A841MRV6_9BACT|nr:DUF2007 domain-containing protein [Algoriphagus iocasae]MBB6328257.1 tetratricopeptide (TPR) repeat protein [Algoriphagus iocasae]